MENNKRGVIIGKCGTGKTSLLNLICNTNRQISNGLSSCTKSNFFADKECMIHLGRIV
jgi:ABC-type molybdenum transport system ATPase subunit/photorepair protein PhrA